MLLILALRDFRTPARRMLFSIDARRHRCQHTPGYRTFIMIRWACYSTCWQRLIIVSLTQLADGTFSDRAPDLAQRPNAPNASPARSGE